MSKLWENLSLHRLARSKSQFAVIVRTFRDKNADVDSSTRVSSWRRLHANKTVSGTSSSGQAETAGASSFGRPVATEDLSSEKNILILMERSTSGSSKIPQIISSRRAEWSTTLEIKC